MTLLLASRLLRRIHAALNLFLPSPMIVVYVPPRRLHAYRFSASRCERQDMSCNVAMAAGTGDGMPPTWVSSVWDAPAVRVDKCSGVMGACQWGGHRAPALKLNLVCVTARCSVSLVHVQSVPTYFRPRTTNLQTTMATTQVSTPLYVPLAILDRNTQRNGPKTALPVGRRPLPPPHMLPSILPGEIDVHIYLFVLVQRCVFVALVF